MGTPRTELEETHIGLVMMAAHVNRGHGLGQGRRGESVTMMTGVDGREAPQETEIAMIVINVGG